MSHTPPRDPRKPRASEYVRERAGRETSTSELQRVKDALMSRGLSPRKRFGQNFLIREELCERIVEHSHLREDDVAVEIGPGVGALTLRIARRVKHLIAVEKDIGLAQYLREECGDVPRITIVEGDFLEFDLAAAAAEHGVDRLVVVGNIPYNVTTPILEHLFASRKVVRTAVLLVQKEYAERLGAAAGTPEYGALTLFARYHALMEPLMTLRSGAFWPRPTVDSMLVRFFMREHPPVDAPEALLFRIIRASFQQRRKQLFSTLDNALQLPRATLESIGRQAGIQLTRRGETLTLDDFARLARAAVDRGVEA